MIRLPKETGPAGWDALLPAREAARPLGENKTADWLIIGAGFAGLSAARALSLRHPNDRIVILDAMRVGEGPAGRNSGFMIDLPHDLASEDYGGALANDIAQTEDNRCAISFARDMVRDFGLPDEAFVESGKVNAAATEKGHHHNEGYAKHLDAMGEDYRFLSASEMFEMTGSRYYQGGLYTPGTVMLQPAMFVRGVAGRLQSNRVALHENSPVTSLEREGADWVAAKDEDEDALSRWDRG